MNEKLFITTAEGRRFAVLPLNGSAAYVRRPGGDLSHLINHLGLPDHLDSFVEIRSIDLRDIKEILGRENPTPEDEVKLTAVLSGDTVIDTAITMESLVRARAIQFNLGQNLMTAALVNFANHPDALATYHLPTRLLIITDRPLNPSN